MKAYEIKCPECGASLEIDGDRDKVFCSYCGTQILLDDEIERKEITHRYVDEAEIVKSNASVELERMRLEHERKEKERTDKVRRNVIIGCSIAFVILFLCVYFMEH